jgi:hypothetical protein
VEVYDVGTVAVKVEYFGQEVVMKRHWDAVVASLGLVLGVAAMAGLLVTEEYAHAAGAEARGYDALFHVVADAGADGNLDAPGDAAGAQPVLVASNEVAR